MKLELLWITLSCWLVIFASYFLTRLILDHLSS